MQITFKKSTLATATTMIAEEMNDIMVMVGQKADKLPTAEDYKDDMSVTKFKNFGIVDHAGDITVTIDEEFFIKYLKITMSLYKAMAPAVMIAVSAFKMFTTKMDSFMGTFMELKEVATEKKAEPTEEKQTTE